MSKLLMLKGLSASGKSTYAREYIAKSGNAARINRDDLRAMLFDSVWTGKRESVVVDIEKAIAEVCFKHDLTAVVDDTNLTQKHRDMWGGFAKAHEATFVIQDFDVPLETCIARDRNRDKPVGAAVIYRMALNAGMIDFGEKPIILCDIDGTISEGTHRQRHLEHKPKRWDDYFAEIEKDEPIDFVIRWVRELSKTHTVCLVSGRPDTYQNQTIRWLDRFGVPFDYLFMRPGGSRESDVIVKTAILNKLPKHLISFAIDDRISVIEDCWKKNGIRCIPVRARDVDFY